MQRNSRLKLAVLATTLYFLVPIARGGQMTGGGEETPDLFELSLEELLDIEVTSVAKKPQPLSEAAAAIFVITQEDIRRSGVTTIPDAPSSTH